MQNDATLAAQRIADYVRSERLRQNMTIEELAQKAGIAVGTLGQFERYNQLNIGVENLLKVTQTLNVGINDMLDVTDRDAEFNELAAQMENLPENKRQDVLEIASLVVKKLS